MDASQIVFTTDHIQLTSINNKHLKQQNNAHSTYMIATSWVRLSELVGNNIDASHAIVLLHGYPSVKKITGVCAIEFGPSNSVGMWEIRIRRLARDGSVSLWQYAPVLILKVLSSDKVMVSAAVVDPRDPGVFKFHVYCNGVDNPIIGRITPLGLPAIQCLSGEYLPGLVSSRLWAPAGTRANEVDDTFPK